MIRIDRFSSYFQCFRLILISKWFLKCQFKILIADIVTIEQTQFIAQRALVLAENDQEAAVKNCFELILGRLPVAEELTVCLQIIEQGDLSLVCRALLNSNEFAFLP